METLTLLGKDYQVPPVVAEAWKDARKDDEAIAMTIWGKFRAYLDNPRSTMESEMKKICMSGFFDHFHVETCRAHLFYCIGARGFNLFWFWITVRKGDLYAQPGSRTDDKDRWWYINWYGRDGSFLGDQDFDEVEDMLKTLLEAKSYSV
jgi:hypothetical protein